MVRPGQTGWLAEKVTAEALAAILDQACTEVARGCNLRDACREVAAVEYGDELQASRYLSLFQSMIAAGER